MTVCFLSDVLNPTALPHWPTQEPSLPVLLHLLRAFTAAFGRALRVAARAQVHFVHLFERLVQIVLQRGHGGADGRGTEAVGDEAEVGQAALDAWLQDGRRPGVPQRGAVLTQQVSELLADLSEWKTGKRTLTILYTSQSPSTGDRLALEVCTVVQSVSNESAYILHKRAKVFT